MLVLLTLLFAAGAAAAGMALVAGVLKLAFKVALVPVVLVVPSSPPRLGA